MKVRTVLILLTAVAAVAITGCGGGDDESSGPPDPAAVAPADSLGFIEVTRPEGNAIASIDALAKKIAGIDDLGEFIISELESSALDSGDELNYAKEIEPWLGDKAGISLNEYDGDDFSDVGIAVVTTDPGEAEEFLEKHKEEAGDSDAEESYEGVDYEVDPEAGSAIGVIDDFVAYGENVQTFEAMVDASGDDSLAEKASYTRAISSAPKNAVADVYADIGGIVKKSGDEIDSDAEIGLSLLGIEPKGATAVASAIPKSDKIEINLSSDVLTDVPPPEDNSFLLSSLPGESVAAITSSGVGESFEQAIDRLDREGLPDEEIPPGELKKVFKAAGVDLDSIAASLTNAGVYLEGSDDSSLGAAAVLIAAGTTPREIVSEVGSFLRSAGVPGVTAIGGKYSGFSVRNSDIGPKPLVVVADEGIHLVVGYGLRAVKRYFEYDELKDHPLFQEATESLEGLPISGFADGPAALRLALNLVSGEDREDLLKAKPYLSKIDFLATASESTEDLAKTKLIVGIGG